MHVDGMDTFSWGRDARRTGLQNETCFGGQIYSQKGVSPLSLGFEITMLLLLRFLLQDLSIVDVLKHDIMMTTSFDVFQQKMSACFHCHFLFNL